MELAKNSNFIFLGFMVWALIAPRLNSPRYGELFLAYMAALLLCLVGTAEIMLTKPIAFFFTIGGVLAFFYVIVRKTIHLVTRRL